MYILTSPFTKTFDTLWLLYFVPDFLESQIGLWMIVEAPIGTKIENAVVLSLVSDLEAFCTENKIVVSEDQIKSITGIVTQTQFISNKNLVLAHYISNHYFTQIHNALNLFFPAIVRKKILSVDEKFFSKLNAPHLTSPLEERNNTVLNIFSEAQAKSYTEIKNNFQKNNKINLLYWVTWSGKTEIYIKLIQENLKSNKQSLLLIPEIILNNQIGEKIINTFWEEVVIINSSITETKKQQAFLEILSWKAKIVIWTRSALFYPFKNLELIVMDEEHDNSYNSDKSPRYKTKEIIEKMLELNPNINVLLWSGTPSVNSMYKAVKWEWNLVNLLEKYDEK